MVEMTYITAAGLRDEFEPVIFSPAGRSVTEARKRNFAVVETLSLGTEEAGGLGLISPQALDFAVRLRPYLARHERLAFLGTRVMHNVVFAVLNLGYRRRTANFHMVHGVEDDARWAQKRALDRVPFPIDVIAVSDFARERMQAYGLRRPVRVIENYLTDERLAAAPRRQPFREPGVRRAAVVARLDPAKRIDVLLACLEMYPELNAITYHIYGDGPEGDALKARALESGLNIVFEGFRSDIDQQLPKADVLVHTGPLEVLPLALLEAHAANVPVVAPDAGGAACVIDDGVNGLRYTANDPASLGKRLFEVLAAEPERLNAFVQGGRVSLAKRFSERERLADYRAAIWESIGRNSSGVAASGVLVG
jgi:glycosyltransferase involved in cell wall biosynthesis